jgi:hypothetical protein
MNATQLDLLERDWVERMKPVVLAKMRGREFTSDDCHAVVEPPSNPNLYGVLFASIRKHLERVGYRPSTRPERNGGVVRVWVIKS